MNLYVRLELEAYSNLGGAGYNQTSVSREKMQPKIGCMRNYSISDKLHHLQT
jgi:hypothetical protein